MHKVYSIVKKRYSNKYFVNFVDFTHESLELGVDVLMKYSISKDCQIDDDLLREILEVQSSKNAKLSAYNYVSYKPRSENEVRVKLSLKGYNQHHIDDAISFLYEYQYLDDENYAKIFIESYLKRKPSGIHKLSTELKKRGIDKNIIQKALDKYFPKESVLDLATTSAKKHHKKIAHKPIDKQKTLLANHLQRSGFDWDIIKETINSIFTDK